MKAPEKLFWWFIIIGFCLSFWWLIYELFKLGMERI